MKTYPERLLDIGIKLLEPYINSTTHTKMQCTECEHVWEATPLSKINNHKRHGAGGCPKCTYNRRYAETQAANIASLPEHIIPDPTWDGNRRFANGKVKFFNTRCGHHFETYPNYVLGGKTECTECGKELRVGKRAIMNLRRKIAANHDEWGEYKAQVRSHTERNYEDHKDIINPNGYPRSILGEEAGYQLDHILPQRTGFELGIPEELLGHPDNLQIIPSHENRQHSAKLKGIPSIFDAYRDIILEYYQGKSNDSPIS